MFCPRDLSPRLRHSSLSWLPREVGLSSKLLVAHNFLMIPFGPEMNASPAVVPDRPVPRRYAVANVAFVHDGQTLLMRCRCFSTFEEYWCLFSLQYRLQYRLISHSGIHTVFSGDLASINIATTQLRNTLELKDVVRVPAEVQLWRLWVDLTVPAETVTKEGQEAVDKAVASIFCGNTGDAV